MKLKELLETFLTYKKSKILNTPAYAIYKNPTLGELKEIVKYNKENIRNKEDEKNINTFRFSIDPQNEILYVFTWFAMHKETTDSLGLDYNKIPRGECYLINNKLVPFNIKTIPKKLRKLFH
jgi:hypothetical protein